MTTSTILSEIGVIEFIFSHLEISHVLNLMGQLPKFNTENEDLNVKNRKISLSLGAIWKVDISILKITTYQCPGDVVKFLNWDVISGVF